MSCSHINILYKTLTVTRKDPDQSLCNNIYENKGHSPLVNIWLLFMCDSRNKKCKYVM